MRNLQTVSLLSVIGLLTACSGETQTLQVEPYKVACMAFVTQMCLLTQNETQTQPTVESDWIEGFDYEWGKRYEIITETTEISDPPADGSSQRVELVEVVKAEPVDAGTTFSFSIQPQEYSRMDYMPHVEQLSADDNTQWRMLDQQPFSCSEEVGQTLVSALTDETDVSLEFEFQEDLSIVLLSVTLL